MVPDMVKVPAKRTTLADGTISTVGTSPATRTNLTTRITRLPCASRPTLRERTNLYQKDMVACRMKDGVMVDHLTFSWMSFECIGSVFMSFVSLSETFPNASLKFLCVSENVLDGIRVHQSNMELGT